MLFDDSWLRYRLLCLPTDTCVRGIMFPGCLSMSVCFSVCFHSSVWACVLLARYLTNQLMEFHQTLTGDVAKGTDELVRCWRSGPKVKVTVRSDIWVSYCIRHTYWRLGVEVSS